MSDSASSASAESPQPLAPADQVLRHQLNILDYWSKRQGAGAVEVGEGLEGRVAGLDWPLPASWSLLGHLPLHQWQIECRERWFQVGQRGVIKVVTGAGKTVLACAIMERLQHEEPDLRVAVVVPTIVLLDQWYDLLTSTSNLPPAAIGRLGGGYLDSFGGAVRILICVLNSAAAKLPKLSTSLQSPLLLVVDECHRAGAAQMSQVFATRRDFNLGLSATPERQDGPEEVEEEQEQPGVLPPEGFDDSLLGTQLGPIIYELDYRKALEAGILSRFVIHHYGLPLEPGECGRYERLSRDITDLRRHLQSQVKGRSLDGGALVGWARRLAARGQSALARQAAEYVSLTGQRKQLLYHAQARGLAVARLVREALAADSSSRIILFHESIAEVMRLFHTLRRHGFPVVAENSELPESLREESIHLFRVGAAQVLVSARSLIEGFDVPAADVGIVVASSSSVRQRIQTLGRILRKKGDNAAAKGALLHVLYMAETSDELIYEKQNWEQITGAARNRYFVWDPTRDDGKPVEKDGPPRRPKPGEDTIDWQTVQLGDAYPGAYEGEEFSCDSAGNVRDAARRLIENPQDVPQRIERLKGSRGRFRVTPRKRAILVYSQTEKGVVFGGFLEHPFRARTDAGSVPADDIPAGHDLVCGAEYAGPVFGAQDLRVQSKAGGYVLARRVQDGEVYARTARNAAALESGREAETLVSVVRQLEQFLGATIRKIKLLPDGTAFCEVGGRRLFLLKLKTDLEFPETGGK
jgi:superfamily II DNA or RNA helicase